MGDQELGYTVEIVENVKEPNICYKEIKLFDDGTAEVELFPHEFEDNEDITDKVEIHRLTCKRCGYEADFEIEVEDPSSIPEYEATLPVTPFSLVYDYFLSKITDDMYMELTELDTYRMLEDLLLSAVHKFEFPRFDITNYEPTFVSDESIYNGVETNKFESTAIIYGGGGWYEKLTSEEINIVATYMIVEWLSQQLASVENTRMKYSGTDFKFTSQANHMAKILSMKKDYEHEGFHLQRLYKRRIKDDKGIQRSTFDTIMEKQPDGRQLGSEYYYVYKKKYNRYR